MGQAPKPPSRTHCVYHSDVYLRFPGVLGGGTPYLLTHIIQQSVIDVIQSDNAHGDQRIKD